VPEAGILKTRDLQQLQKELTQNFMMTLVVDFVRTVPQARFTKAGQLFNPKIRAN